MIKGVNKQVLEINETHNGYFEKAIFFVNPEYCGLSEGKLREKAGMEIEAAGKPPRKQYGNPHSKKRRVILSVAIFIAGVICGIAATSIF